MHTSHFATLFLLALLQAPVSATPLVSEKNWPAHVVQRADSKAAKAICRLLAPGNLRGRAVDDVAQDLLRLGPDSVPALFAYFAGTLEGPIPEFTEEPLPDGAPPPPPVPNEEAILIAAFRSHPRDAVVSAVASAALSGGPDLALVAMRVLGEVGGERAVAAWIDIATALEPIHLDRLFVRTPTEGALARILESEDAAFESLARRVPAVEPRLRPCIVRALGLTGRARCIEVLFALLGENSELDVVVLAEIGRITEKTVGSLDEHELRAIRACTSHEDSRVRRETLSTLARVHDVEAYVHMVGALEDEELSMRQTAAWALRKLSGLDFGADASVWKGWFEREHEWWITVGAGSVEGLSAADRSTVIAAMSALAGRPLYRHHAASAITPLLAHADPEVALAAASTLGVLGSGTAKVALVQALESEHEPVRDAALGALRLLTRIQLPPDADAWLAALR